MTVNKLRLVIESLKISSPYPLVVVGDLDYIPAATNLPPYND